MRIGEKLSILPEAFGELTQAEFLAKFKGKAPDDKLKEAYKECKKAFKAKK